MTTDTPVYCENCSGVEVLSRKRDWFYWRCIMAPAPAREQFVVEEQFLHESPHRRCQDVNPDGKCAMFELKPDQPKEK